MLHGTGKYFSRNANRALIVFVVLLLTTAPSKAQESSPAAYPYSFHINPILDQPAKRSFTASPNLNKHFNTQPKGELMFWPNFPLTAEQIARRDEKLNQPFLQQVIDDVGSNVIKTIIYGRKKAPASPPRF